MAQVHDTLPDAEVAALLARLPFPCLSVPGDQALATWERLRAEGDGWPVIVGTDRDLEIFHRNLISDSRVRPYRSDILEQAGELETEGLEARFLAWSGSGEEDVNATRQQMMAQWPDDPEPGNVAPITLKDSGGVHHRRLHLFRLPVQDGAEALALFDWGGWNDTPTTPHLIAALREWNKFYGAELVVLGHDCLELKVANPPETREAALALAEQHMLICREPYLAGATMQEEAARLLNSAWWFFWWD